MMEEIGKIKETDEIMYFVVHEFWKPEIASRESKSEFSKAHNCHVVKNVPLGIPPVKKDKQFTLIQEFRQVQKTLA